MRGPAILARTMSTATQRGGSAKAWQYHSRSDNHSKVACWTLLFDLLLECDALRRAADQGRIAFGINHVMAGQINKTLDLVVSIVPPERPSARRRTLQDVTESFGIALSADDIEKLRELPAIEEDRKSDVSEVAIALKAKACMTEHVKSLPRLHAEILATGYLARKASPRSITVSYSLINAATEFTTPSSGSPRRNVHKQPDDARRVAEMIRTAVPTVSDARDYGYDVVGITVVDCRNDGSAVRVVDDPNIAPARTDRTNYERMVRSICSEFRGRFGR